MEKFTAAGEDFHGLRVDLLHHQSKFAGFVRVLYFSEDFCFSFNYNTVRVVETLTSQLRYLRTINLYCPSSSHLSAREQHHELGLTDRHIPRKPCFQPLLYPLSPGLIMTSLVI